MAEPQAGTVNPYAAPRAAVGDAAEETQPVRIFSVSGRIGRVRYVGYLIGLYILFGIAAFLAALVAAPLAIVAWLAYIVLAFMLTIQRCHDFNTTGWLSLVSLIPLVNLIFWFIPGSEGANRYGPRTPPNSTLALILVWILPAIAVIGIVAAIAIPAYQGYLKRAQQVEMRR
jgi:uncharacterized membrane protein YhaH (DUF805 family)